MDKAAILHPNAVWWIKGDGCDVVTGLGESVSNLWSGDVDLNDGKLNEMYDIYSKRLSFIASLGIERHGIQEILEDVIKIEDEIKIDISFLLSG